MKHDHGMEGMQMSPPPSSTASTSPVTSSMTSHMTFYWGTHAEILFRGFPGPHSNTKFYLSLLLLFLLSFSLEWLSLAAKFLAKTRHGDVVHGVFLALLHVLRMGLAYLVMLALMSFNGPVFVTVLLGHGLGFLVFGTRVFGSGARKGSDDPDLPPYERATDIHLPPLSC